jgi:hypothetical protein
MQGDLSFSSSSLLSSPLPQFAPLTSIPTSLFHISPDLTSACLQDTSFLNRQRNEETELQTDGKSDRQAGRYRDCIRSLVRSVQTHSAFSCSCMSIPHCMRHESKCNATQCMTDFTRPTYAIIGNVRLN